MPQLQTFHDKLQEIQGTLLPPPRWDRLLELGDFVQALEEWGVDDTGEAMRAINDFVRSRVGLAEYRIPEHPQ